MVRPPVRPVDLGRRDAERGRRRGAAAGRTSSGARWWPQSSTAGRSCPRRPRPAHVDAAGLIVPARPIRLRTSGRAVRRQRARASSISADYTTEAWRKLGINVMANGVTALTRQPMRVFRRPEASPARLPPARRVLDRGAADGAALSVGGRPRESWSGSRARRSTGAPRRCRTVSRDGRPSTTRSYGAGHQGGAAARHPDAVRRDDRGAPRRR